MELASRYSTDIINISINLILCGMNNASINDVIQRWDSMLHLKPGLIQIRTIKCNYCNVSTEYAAFFFFYV